MGINPGNPAFGLPPAEDDSARQVKDLERTTRENLASVVSSFKTTVERLDAAIETQSQMIADLQAVVNAQVVPRVTSSSSNGFPLSTTNQVKVHTSIVVPAGYSRALVSASGAVGGSTSSTGGDRLYANIVINGVPSPSTLLVVSASTPFGVAPAFGTANLSGLSGGSISIDLAASLQIGPTEMDPGLSTANLSAQVIFLR